MVANTMKKPEEGPTSIKINSKILFGSCRDSTGKGEYWFQEGLVQSGAVRTDQTYRNLECQACALYIYVSSVLLSSYYKNISGRLQSLVENTNGR